MVTRNVPLPYNGTNAFSQTVAVAQAEFFGVNSANGSIVTLQLVGPPLLYSGGVVVTWQAGLYTNSVGWPTCGTYYQGRLWLAGVVPNRVDASMSNDLFTFSPTEEDGTVDASTGISAVFNADDVNPIFWMQPDLAGIICGTLGGEFLIQAPTSGPISAINISVERKTKVGCANIEPRRCEHTTVFVQKFQRKVMEYFPDVFSGKFSAPDLNKRSKHLTINNIEEIAYQQELSPTIWARCGDGSLIGATYKRDTLMTSQGPTFIGWHRHALGSGRTVQSVCVGPSFDGDLDALSMITLDMTGVYHVETMQPIFDESGTLDSAWFVDNGIAPPSYSTVTTPGSLVINGLWDLNGATVSVWAAGLDCGDYTVANGSVTVPFGDGIAAGTAQGLFTQTLVESFPPLQMPLAVGFTYTSQGQRVRPITPADTGARNGPGFAKLKRSHQVGVLFFNVGIGAISLGTDFVKNIRPVLFKQANGQALPITGMFAGIYWDTLDADYSYDDMECWQITRPYPATVCAIGSFRETQDT